MLMRPVPTFREMIEFENIYSRFVQVEWEALNTSEFNEKGRVNSIFSQNNH